MPRKIIPLVTGETYHVYNRGVDKRIIFEDKIDLARFYKCLQVFNQKGAVGSLFRLNLKKNQILSPREPIVKVHAYCLLPNHYHLLITQLVDGGISEYMKRVSGGYTSYFNERYDRSGSLFQGTFKRVHIESDEQIQYVIAYINCNNTVHGLSNDTLIKSSLGAYAKKQNDVLLGKVLFLPKNGDEYRREVTSLANKIRIKRQSDKKSNPGTLLE